MLLSSTVNKIELKGKISLFVLKSRDANQIKVFLAFKGSSIKILSKNFMLEIRLIIFIG